MSRSARIGAATAAGSFASSKIVTAALATVWWAAAALAQPGLSAQKWPCLCADGGRTGTRSTCVGSLAAPRWVLSHTPQGQEIAFVGPAGVVAAYVPSKATPAAALTHGADPERPGGRSLGSVGNPASVQRVRAAVPRLFAAATIDGQSRALSIDARTGQIAWNKPIPGFIYDSWSTPAIDAPTGVVLFFSGSQVTALRQGDGSLAWQSPTVSFAINASPVVTDDLGPRGRAFVVDDGGFGGPSFLYCINLSARDGALNPFDPGETVWATPCGSAAGATPAYLDGVVYVASTGLDQLGFGEIRAFDATALTAPAPLWTFTNTIPASFFGGVTVRDTPGGRFVYGATYAFFGGLDSSNLVKVDASTGGLEWSVACNRTASIPVVLPDGRVALAAGIQGFGSVPSVELFRDDGASATMLWDTAIDTWDDANENGLLDLGEFLVVGGWTTHPALAIAPDGSPRLVVGAIPTDGGFEGPYTRLFELNLNKAPAQAGFIVQEHEAGGSTPAMLGAGVYTVGTWGLAAFGPTPP